jgi:hypothetical protein
MCCGEDYETTLPQLADSGEPLKAGVRIFGILKDPSSKPA